MSKELYEFSVHLYYYGDDEEEASTYFRKDLEEGVDWLSHPHDWEVKQVKRTELTEWLFKSFGI